MKMLHVTDIGRMRFGERRVESLERRCLPFRCTAFWNLGQ
jgi:hypothetical protein